MKKLLTILLLACSISVAAQEYVSDTMIIGTQEDSLTWEHSIGALNLIQVDTQDQLIQINDDQYEILQNYIQEDCKEITAVKRTGEYKNFIYLIEICDLYNGQINILISRGKSNVLFVCTKLIPQ
jgi:hypothetical protein